MGGVVRFLANSVRALRSGNAASGKMASKAVLLLQQLQRPIKVVKWKVSEGSSLSIGRVVLLYEIDGAQRPEQRRLKSVQAGTVSKIVAPEGAIVKPGATLLELSPCLHPTIMKDMCAECGADLRKDDLTTSASVPMVHAIPELKVSEELAQKLGKADGERLLRDRKLVLLVDLDQTIIHTTNDNVPANIKDVYHFQLYGPNSPWYHTRLRPGTHQFLKNVAEYFELHICTFGARNYAHTITTFLDADHSFFSNRILSRDECIDPTSKKTNLKALFPCGDNMVCIIDDREDVWSHALNLIHVKPYHFFQHTGDINAPPGLDKHERDNTDSPPWTRMKIRRTKKANGGLQKNGDDKAPENEEPTEESKENPDQDNEDGEKSSKRVKLNNDEDNNEENYSQNEKVVISEVGLDQETKDENAKANSDDNEKLTKSDLKNEKPNNLIINKEENRKTEKGVTSEVGCAADKKEKQQQTPQLLDKEDECKDQMINKEKEIKLTKQVCKENKPTDDDEMKCKLIESKDDDVDDEMKCKLIKGKNDDEMKCKLNKNKNDDVEGEEKKKSEVGSNNKQDPVKSSFIKNESEDDQKLCIQSKSFDGNIQDENLAIKKDDDKQENIKKTEVGIDDDDDKEGKALEEITVKSEVRSKDTVLNVNVKKSVQAECNNKDKEDNAILNEDVKSEAIIKKEDKTVVNERTSKDGDNVVDKNKINEKSEVECNKKDAVLNVESEEVAIQSKDDKNKINEKSEVECNQEDVVLNVESEEGCNKEAAEQSKDDLIETDDDNKVNKKSESEVGCDNKEEKQADEEDRVLNVKSKDCEEKGSKSDLLNKINKSEVESNANEKGEKDNTDLKDKDSDGNNKSEERAKEDIDLIENSNNRSVSEVRSDQGADVVDIKNGNCSINELNNSQRGEEVVEDGDATNEMIEVDDTDDYLKYLEDILKRIHATFYEEYDKLESGDVPDLKRVIPAVRSTVLKGTKLVFSGLVPTHIKLEQSKAYQVARSLGAEVSQDLEPDTTHLVAVRPGTAKVNAGRRKKTLKIVTPDWLWACAERWEHLEERIYPLNSRGSKNRHPPPHVSPEHIPNYNEGNGSSGSGRKRTASGRFMDTINPLMSFSSADIADMDKEVESMLLDEDEEEESDTEEEATKKMNEQILKKKQNNEIAAEDSSSSSSNESLSEEYPRGYKRLREKSIERQQQQKQDKGVDENTIDDEEEEDDFPSAKFRRGEQLDSDLDIGQESNSEGSVDAPDDVDDGDWNMMGAKLERDFLANN